MVDAIRPLRDLERAAVLDALTRLRGDKRAAARALGISPRTVYHLLHRWGVPLDYGTSAPAPAEVAP